MRVLIAAHVVPHMHGELSEAVKRLKAILKQYDYEVDTIVLPAPLEHEGIIEHILSLRLYDLELICDKVICMGYLSHLVKHSNKIVWFSEYFKDFYDAWNEYKNQSADEKALREYIMRADYNGFSEVNSICSSSTVAAKRIIKYSNIQPTTLYLPPENLYNYKCKFASNYIYYNSSICEENRQLELIKALKNTKTKVKLVIAGKIREEEYAKKLQNEIEISALQKRVKIITSELTEAENGKLMGKCLAYAYVPKYSEGFFIQPINACFSEKPLICATPIHQTDENLFDESNSVICNMEDIAEKLDFMKKNKRLAKKMGKNSKRIVENLILKDKLIRGLVK